MAITNPNAPATRKQTWKLFTLTKKDYREENLTVQQASELIEKFSKEKDQKTENFQSIWDEAVKAGQKALEECKPTPMIVAKHSNPIDDNSPVEKAWNVPDGVCGFAWVTIHPGTTSFARWLRKTGKAGKAYYGGMQVWISKGGQSYERKMAYAGAMAGVFEEHGFKAYAGGRLD